MENKEKKEEKGSVVSEAKKLKDSLKDDALKPAEKEGIMQHIDMKIVSLFIVGFLVGLIIKTQATKTVVMGANDPQLEKTRGEYLLTEVGIDEEEELESDEDESEQVDVEEETVDAEGETEEKIVEEEK